LRFHLVAHDTYWTLPVDLGSLFGLDRLGHHSIMSLK
jgi:hypothetical protein